MATQDHIKQFDPTVPGKWDSYATKLEFCRVANNVTDPVLKRAMLFSVWGPATFKIPQALEAPTKLSEMTFNTIMLKLRTHFASQPLEIACQHEFYKRNQASGKSIEAFITTLWQDTHHCNFSDLEIMLHNRLVCSLRDEKLQQGLFAKKDLAFQVALDEALMAETINKMMREIRQVQSPPMAWKAEAVHSDKIVDSEEDEEVLRLCLGLSKCFGQQRGAEVNCTSCGGQHECQSCHFCDVQCWECGKTGHIECTCQMKEQWGTPWCPTLGTGDGHCRTPGAIECHAISECTCTQEPTATSTQNAQPICEKIRVAVIIQGTPCEMEVDSGSALSVISAETYHHICQKGGAPCLQPFEVILTDFQGKQVPIQGIGTFTVQFKHFSGPLQLVVVKGHHTSLLGLNWFDALGIHITGVQHIGQSSYEAICDEFAAVFDVSLECYKGPPVALSLNPAVVPIRMKARQVPFALKPKIDAELDHLIKQGVLEPVLHAQWETPIVTCLKANGNVRICADYKCTLNKALQQHAYPVPVVSHLLASLASGKVFAKLDLTQAYQQLPVDEATSEAQTIVTHHGAFRVKRLQFGVSVAPGLFQNLMEDVLKGLPGVIPYFGDVLIAGGSEAELACRLREVLCRFQDAGLKVKKEKCQLGVPEVEFLGFLINADGIHPTPAKVKAIHSAPPPRCKQELQSFLGLLNFYHSFIPHKAATAEPLHQLLNKKAPWIWGCAQDTAFNAVKHLLSSDSVITHFNETKPVVLACDVSPYGIGAVLSHQLPDGREAPIEFYSRTLSSTECNYAQIDKEALAVVAGVNKFHNYIYGRHFTIVTDHKPLLGLFAPDRQTPQILSPRMLRWSIFLNAYDYALHHRPSKSLGHTAALSHLPLPDIDADPSPAHSVMLLETLPQPPLHTTDVAMHSAKDRTLSRVLNWVWRGWPVGHLDAKFSPFISRQHELSVHKGCLLWGNRVVIPAKLQTRVLEALHVSHPGIVRMKALARSYVWWPGIDAELEEWIRCCQTCQEFRPAMPQSLIQPWEMTRKPWSRLHIDFAGPLQGQTFLIIVDDFSKWLEVVPVSAMNSKVAIWALKWVFTTHGLPDIIVSDNGAQFTSAEFQKFMADNLIQHDTSSPFHPSTNGQAERMVRTTKESLTRIVQGDWNQRLADFLLQQHITPCTATDRSPAELLMNRKLASLLDRLHPNIASDWPPGQEPPAAPMSFTPDDPVYTQNYGDGLAWIPAATRATWPVSYKVAMPDSRVHRQHVDQVWHHLTDAPAPAAATTPKHRDEVNDQLGSQADAPKEDPVFPGSTEEWGPGTAPPDSAKATTLVTPMTPAPTQSLNDPRGRALPLS
uniref:Gypsy retrotransposon integrase-like protein 1 n=1 Tax=Podarcis muralis TaxID=64176 RepID=A0A670JYW7_PODMU|nr:uncharacterized protein K02A2.6-like [Podarcis muralis]